jgi:hypothetical protein
VEEWISQQTLATGISDDQLRPSLERLTRSYGSIEEAQAATTLAMEIATQTGKPLEDVSNALAKANDGQVGALKRLGISIGPNVQGYGLLAAAQKDLTKLQTDANLALQEYGPNSEEYLKAQDRVEKAQKKVNDITAAGVDWMGELGDQFKGSLAADSETAEGKMRRLQNSLSETKETIGYALMPVLEAVLGPLKGMADWASQNTGLIMALGGVIALLAGGILAVNAGMAIWNAYQTAAAAKTVIWTGIQAAFNAVMALNPITLVVIAIAALVAGIILAYNKVDWFRNGVNAALTFVKNLFVGVVEWVTEKVPAGFQVVVDFVKGIPGMLADAGKTLVNVITAPYRLAFNKISELWNSTVGGFEFTVPDWIPIVGGKTFSIPKLPTIPALAEGGIVMGPTLALVGEAGPEAVIPLNRAGAVGGITINVSGALDPVSVAQQIRRLLQQQDSRLGLA